MFILKEKKMFLTISCAQSGMRSMGCWKGGCGLATSSWEDNCPEGASVWSHQVSGRVIQGRAAGPQEEARHVDAFTEERRFGLDFERWAEFP